MLVTSTMPPMPAEAEAPPDFGHALHAERRGFGFERAALQLRGCGYVGVEQIEIGEVAREQRGVGKTDIFIVWRNARHRNGAFGKRGHGIAAGVIGRDHRLAPADQHAQADIVALGPLGFLDAAVAHLDALRDATHRDRIGRICAGAFGSLHQPLREIRERRLVKQVAAGCGRIFGRKRRAW
ncbi:hypothetical protein ACVWWR_001977 [Bradyrhizobium sp. LM3.2]